MIAHLRGEVIAVSVGEAVLDVGGVGYVVQLTRRAQDRLPVIGREARVPVRMLIRQDNMALFAFADVEERATFDVLIGVTGIGPKVAAALLSHLAPTELRAAVAAKDRAKFMQVPGIGRKTADRLLLELKDWAGEGPAVEAPSQHPGDDTWLEAEAALFGLGYVEAEVREALAGLDLKETSAGDIVRAALRRLGRAVSPVGGDGR